MVPARDGLLRDLGFDVAELGLRALGLVFEAKPGKAYVHFPEIKVAAWLNADELASVEQEAAAGHAEFVRLLEQGRGAPPAERLLVWTINEVCRKLPVTHVLEIESGLLLEMWDEPVEDIPKYTSLPAETEMRHVALGLSELRMNEWEEVRRELGERLLFARFLPSSMRKLELSLYLKPAV